MKRHLAALLFLSMLAGCAGRETLDAGSGRSALGPEKTAGLRTGFQAAVESGQAAGIAWGFGRLEGPESFGAVGQRDLGAKTPMQPDTICRIASMTKPITALAILMLEEAGKLSVDDPVSRFVPEFGKIHPAVPITLRHLLTHTSGIPGEMPPGFAELYARRDRTLAEAAPAFAREPVFEPGSKWSYCNPGIDTLGRVVEVASGKPFEKFLRERLFEPLGMKDTVFQLTPDLAARAARTYYKQSTGLAPAGEWLGGYGEVKYPLPAGGLWSTAPDLARLYRMLLAGGEINGRRYLNSETIKKAASDQAALVSKGNPGALKAGFTPGMAMGLGFQVVEKPQDATAALSPGSYGHGGAFGTQGWLDPVKKTFYILMVQREGFGNGDASDLRKMLQDLGAAALGD